MIRLILTCLIVLALAYAAPHVAVGEYHERNWAAIWVRWE